MRRRRGYLLAEALCALALSGVLAVAAAATLQGTRRVLAVAEERTRAERVAREALAVTEALLRRSDSLVVLGDTAIEFSLLIGAGVVCAADSITSVLTPERVRTGVPLTDWAEAASPGDLAEFFLDDSSTRARRWSERVVVSVSEQVAAAPCDATSGWLAIEDAAAKTVSLQLGAPLSGIIAGTPVRVRRRGRLALYVDGRGEWMLGWRRCTAGACGVIQPVAGPLRSPGNEGYRIVVPAGDSGVRISVRVPGVAPRFEIHLLRGDAFR